MASQDKINIPFRLETQYRDYVWGGRHLRPDVPGPTAEAWIVYEKARILDGPLTGMTLAEACEENGIMILGQRPLQKGLRFPLLIKLLDCADWLSIQVHPNDLLAQQLEGPDQNGKTEAWHILSADQGAFIYCGIKPGTTKESLKQSILNGQVMDIVEKIVVGTGDSILIRAGMVHALGPGLMVYEVQQAADITYRVFDWNRPASENRPLHTDKALEVIDPSLQSSLVPPPELGDGECTTLVKSEYFHLQAIGAQTQPIEMDTAGETFHALTVLEGRVRLEGSGWEMVLERWQSTVVPAAAGKYRIIPEGGYSLLRAAVD
jgi:mannose-6-phosphate isomerase